MFRKWIVRHFYFSKSHKRYWSEEAMTPSRVRNRKTFVPFTFSITRGIIYSQQYFPSWLFDVHQMKNKYFYYSRSRREKTMPIIGYLFRFDKITNRKKRWYKTSSFSNCPNFLVFMFFVLWMYHARRAETNLYPESSDIPRKMPFIYSFLSFSPSIITTLQSRCSFDV